MAIFRFFKMAAAATLDLKKNFLTVGTVKSVEPRHYAKFYRNRLNRGRDIAIFGFFQMVAAVILDFKIFNGQTRQEGRTTSLCQISTKSLQSRPTYGDFLLFKMAAAAIFGF